MESPKSYATATKTSPISHTAVPEEKPNMETLGQINKKLNREKAFSPPPTDQITTPLPHPSVVDPTLTRQDPIVKFIGNSIPSEMLDRALDTQTELIPTPGTKARVQGVFTKILGKKARKQIILNPTLDLSEVDNVTLKTPNKPNTPIIKRGTTQRSPIQTPNTKVTKTNSSQEVELSNKFDILGAKPTTQPPAQPHVPVAEKTAHSDKITESAEKNAATHARPTKMVERASFEEEMETNNSPTTPGKKQYPGVEVVFVTISLAAKLKFPLDKLKGLTTKFLEHIGHDNCFGTYEPKYRMGPTFKISKHLTYKALKFTYPGLDLLFQTNRHSPNMSPQKQPQQTPQQTTSIGVVNNISTNLTIEQVIKKLQLKPDQYATLYRLKNKVGKITNTIKIIFNTALTPLTLCNGTIAVKPHLFSIVRCTWCQKHGHTTAICKQQHPTCPYCAGTHTYDQCTSTHWKCSNCKSTNHGAAYRGCPDSIKYKQQITDKNQTLITEHQARLNSTPKKTKQQQPAQQQTTKQIPQPQATNTNTNTMDTLAPRIAEAILHALNDTTFRTLGHIQQKDTLINILNNTHTPTDTQPRSPACKTTLTYAEATAKTPEPQPSQTHQNTDSMQTPQKQQETDQTQAPQTQQETDLTQAPQSQQDTEQTQTPNEQQTLTLTPDTSLGNTTLKADITNTPENITESPKVQHITGDLYFDTNTKKFSKKLMALAKFNNTPTDKLKEMLEKKHNNPLGFHSHKKTQINRMRYMKIKNSKQ